MSTTPTQAPDAVDLLVTDFDGFFDFLISPPAQKPASVLGGSGAGLVGIPTVKRGDEVFFRGLRYRVSKVSGNCCYLRYIGFFADVRRDRPFLVRSHQVEVVV